jgi:hypothetical protein
VARPLRCLSAGRGRLSGQVGADSGQLPTPQGGAVWPAAGIVVRESHRQRAARIRHSLRTRPRKPLSASPGARKGVFAFLPTFRPASTRPQAGAWRRETWLKRGSGGGLTGVWRGSGAP